MQAFAHFTVFYSLIIGLTVARVLAGFAELIHKRVAIGWSLAFGLWGLLVLLTSAYEWWVILRWEGIKDISFFQFLFISIRPAILYLIAHILFPDFTREPSVDLRAHLAAVQRWVFPLLLVFLLVGVADTALKGAAYFARVFPNQWPFTLSGIAIALMAARTKNDRLQAGLASLMIVRLVLVAVVV
jgi:hypothetical protein